MMILLIIFSLLLPSTIVAHGIVPNEFIDQYDPDKSYQSGSEYIDTPPVQRMPLHDSDQDKLSQIPLEEISRDNTAQQSRLLHTDTLFSSLQNSQIDILALISISTLILVLQQIRGMLSSLRAGLWKPKRQSTGRADSPSDQHLQIKTIPLALAYGENSMYLSRFSSDPSSKQFPNAVQEVLRWDQRWNPEKYPQDYLQCTTYVAITYQLNGISLKGKIQGDARDWIHLDSTFTVYQSGISTTPPQPLDTVVWANGTMNHVGIVTDVRTNRITVANGNSTTEYHYYQYRTTADGKIEITSLNGETAQSAWVPSHWLRPKETVRQAD